MLSSITWFFVFQTFAIFAFSLNLNKERLTIGQDDYVDFEQFLIDFMRCRQVPGLSLAVVLGNQTLFTRGYGLANEASGRPVTKHTRFCIASCTKAFTTTLLGKLLHQKSLPWTTKVRDVVGDCCDFPNKTQTDSVTLEDLVLHRTGLVRDDVFWFSGQFNKEEILRQIKYMGTADKERPYDNYNNIMYALAGYATEKLGGKTWEELIQVHLLKPLGMNEATFYRYLIESPDTFAKSYNRIDGKNYEVHPKLFRGASAISPAIALCSSAVDMSKWLKFHISDGLNEEGNTVVDQDVVRDTHIGRSSAQNMYKSQIKPPKAPVQYLLDSYGYGWFTGRYRDLSMISHYGYFAGYNSHISILPTSEIGIFTSINGGEQNLPYTINSLLHTYLLDMLLGETPWIKSRFEEACIFPNLTDFLNYELWDCNIEENLRSSRPLETYAGTYTNLRYGNMTVYANDSTQLLETSYGLIKFQLYPLKSDTFCSKVKEVDWLMPHLGIFNFTINANKSSNMITQWPYAPVFERIYANGLAPGSASCSVHFTRIMPYFMRVYFTLCAFILNGLVH